MIEFKPLNRYDDEVLQLFKECRQFFEVLSKKTTKKQIAWFVKSCKSHFYKVYYDYKFIGCIWFHDWNNENKTVLLSGFSKKNSFKENSLALKLICDKYLKECNYDILSVTKYLTAKILLIKSNFIKKNDNIYIYNRKGVI